MDIKTNVIRYLDQRKINYVHHTYSQECALSAEEVAQELNFPEVKIFKTLVTAGKSGRNYVFVIPGNTKLDLKKAAKACGEKAIQPVPSKTLLELTGYVHGGCSPIGMKKLFATYFDQVARSQSTIVVSAGKIGHQIEIDPEVLSKLVKGRFADLTQQN